MEVSAAVTTRLTVTLLLLSGKSWLAAPLVAGWPSIVRVAPLAESVGVRVKLAVSSGTVSM